jgi:putative transposase
MRRSRFTVEEIIRIIAESELPTVSIAGTARKYGITEATLYRWRAKYKGLSTSEAKHLKVLEDENRRLKKLVAEKGWSSRPWTRSLKKVLSPGQKRQVVRELRQAGLTLGAALTLV